MSDLSDIATHTRAGNALMNDSNGVLKWAPHNLLLRSEEFDNASWGLDNGGAASPIVTANVGIAPDGTTTADRILLNKTGGTFSRIQQNRTGLPSSIYTFSVWLKNNGTGIANVGIRIDAVGLNCEVTETWQLFTVSLLVAGTSAAAQILLFDSISGNDETADILAWGAHAYRSDLGGMVNNPDTGDSYVPTTSAAVYLPRVGHHLWNGTAWVDAGYFHESEARTNLFLDTANPETQTIPVTEGSTYTASFRAGTPVVDINETLAINAVDVFVYDTSKDSDGGAWRTGALAQASSWYNETLNTATRGSRREFPSVAVIVAESGKITIYDGDDPAMPMWMVFNGYIGGSSTGVSTVRAVTAFNGEMNVATNGATNDYQSGLPRVRFVKDVYSINRGSALDDTLVSDGQILNRNVLAFGSTYATGQRLVSGYCNDIAMTVLPDAPIDAATGLPVPTIAVATDGGVSVIKDDGTVVDIYPLSTPEHWKVEFVGEKLMMQGAYLDYSPWVVSIPDADVTGWMYQAFPTGITLEEYSTTGSTAPSGANLFFLGPTGQRNKPMVAFGSTRYLCTASGLSIIAANEAVPSEGMVAYVTSSWNSGYQNGDIKGAFLSDTDDTDLVGGTDADRSVNANPLTVNGTVTRTPVATGADTVAYSGFSASNYLEQPYNPDLDFGTGDFCIMGWLIAPIAPASGNFLFDRDGATGGRLSLFVSGSTYRIICSAAATSISTGVTVKTGLSFFAIVRETGILKLYVDGQLQFSVANTDDISSTDAILTIGTDAATKTTHLNSSLALWRISATAPTAAQISRIYNDEKLLFQENAQATLYGTSDAVTALAHDSDTDLLHVGTSAGRSVFSGLRRINNTTTGVTTAISATNSVIGEQ